MNKSKKKTFVIVLAIVLTVALIPAYLAFADGDFISAGNSQINAGEGYSFRINLDSFKSEYEETSKPYTLTVQISPNPESVSVSPDVNVQQFGSKLTFSSADLSAVNSLTINVYPGSNLMQPQTYDISVNVAGELSTPSAQISFTATPAQNGSGENGEDMNGKMNGKMSGKSGSMSSGSSGSVDSSLVYAGHWDNYLDALAVDGYEFTNKFNKTRDTYFINVPEDVESVDVSATASDSSATVRIVGEDNISEDYSKIMINVTADNGEVRTYRIYVTHNTEEQ